MSPSSIGSGASTPTHHVAPPAPSMLPAATISGQRQEETGAMSAHSLIRMRDQKRGSVSQTPVASNASPIASAARVEAQYKAQQMEISQLKKERDDTIKRLTKLEAYVEESKAKPHEDVSELLQLVLDRLTALEKFPRASELPSLRKGLEELSPVLNRLEAVEQSQRATDQSSLRKDLGGKSTPQTQAADLKPLLERIDRLEAASSKCVEDIRNALTQAKNGNNAVGEIPDLKRDIAPLKDKNPKTTAIDEKTMKQLVLDEVLAKTDDAKKVLRTEVNAVETRLAARITDDQKKILKLETKANMSMEFKSAMEKLNLPSLSSRLTDLQDKLREVEGNDAMTYKKTSRLTEIVDDLDGDRRKFDRDIDKLFARCNDADTALDDLKKEIDDYIGPIEETYKNTEKTMLQRLARMATTVGQVPHHQSELTKLSTVNDDLGRLSARLDELEKAASASTGAPGPRPGFKQVRKPVSSSPSKTNNDNITNTTNQRMDQLDKDVKELWQALETKGLASKFERIDARLATSEENVSSTVTEFDTRLSERIQSLTTTLGNRLSDVETRINGVNDALEGTTALDGRLTNVEARVEGLKNAPDNTTPLAHRVSDVEQRLTSLTDAPDSTATLEKRLSDVETRVESLKDAGGSAQPSDPAVNTEDSISSISSIRNEIGELDTGLTDAEATIHQHTIDIAALQGNLTLLFEENFDPFKLTVEGQLATINSKLEAYGLDVNDLRQQLKESRTQSLQSGLGDGQQAQLQSIAQDAIALKASMDQLLSSLQAESNARIQGLSTKADAQETKNQLEAFKFVVNHLEGRYENITTDDIHQRMVYWFTQMHPHANGLTNYPQIQQDINQLKSFQRQCSWLQNLSQDLSNLVQMIPQLKGLATNASELKMLVDSAPRLQELLDEAPQPQALAAPPSESPATLAKIEQACSDVITAVTKADHAEQQVSLQTQTLKGIEAAISGLQTSFRNLNSPTSPFIRTEALSNLETQIKALIDDQKKEREDTINGLRTTFGEEHDKRVKAEKQIKASINELKQMKTDLDDKVTKLDEQLNQTEASSSQLRQDFDTMNNTLIEPNRDFLGLFGTMLAVVTQLQQVIESLNRNLPVKPLEFEWEYYLPTLGQPETNGSNTTKGKGKSKCPTALLQ
jgi:DNA repair exonuclease SbcCD ATPase subunit